MTVYVGAADVYARLKPRLRKALRDRLVEADVEPLARLINGLINGLGPVPTYTRLELEAERLDERLGAVMPIFGDAIRRVTARLDQARANRDAGHEDQLARIFNRLLEDRLEHLKIAREVTRTMWEYGPSFLSATPVKLDHLMHALDIADATLAVVQMVKRKAGEKPRRGYGAKDGPVIAFTRDALRTWLPQLLPDVELLGPDHLRNMLELLRKARDRAGG
jgi:hypothetical protein